MSKGLGKKVVIVNRMVCKRKPSGFSEDVIKKMLKTYLNAFSVVFTDHKGHAFEIAKDSYDAEMIVVAGGDGTIYEVINGMDMERQVLGVIPIGTGNSLARHFGIRPFTHAMEEVKKGQAQKVDLIQCKFIQEEKLQIRYAIATCGIGYTAWVTNLGNKFFKPFGKFCYLAASVLTLFTQKEIEAAIKIDVEEEKVSKFNILIVNNTKYSGNFLLFRTADLSDGKMEYMQNNANPLKQLIQNLAVLSRLYFYMPGTLTKVKEISIKTKAPQKLMLDGEIFDGVTEAVFKAVPQKLRIII